LENDPALVPPLVSQFREDLIEMGLCDLTGATRAGIALEEALLNAVYHGNLEVSSDLRQNGDEAFHRLARERRSLEPYSARRVRVTARLTTTHRYLRHHGRRGRASTSPSCPTRRTRTSSNGRAGAACCSCARSWTKCGTIPRQSRHAGESAATGFKLFS